MMKGAKIKIDKSSQKGITLIDVTIAILIIMIFVGTVCTLYLRIMEVKASTAVTSKATICAIKILEDIDRIPYDSVNNDMETYYKIKFSIPDEFNLTLKVSSYDNEEVTVDAVKEVKLEIKFNFNGKEEKLAITRYKVREF